MIKTFVSKPVPLIQFTGDNIDEISSFIWDEYEVIDTREMSKNNYITVKLKNDDHPAYTHVLAVGDYIRPKMSDTCVGLRIVEVFRKKEIEQKYDEIIIRSDV